jgi:ribosome maturation factor RimP
LKGALAPILLTKILITPQHIIDLAEQKIEGTNLFLVDVKVGPGNKIEVLLDGDKGLAISDCVSVSRHIEKSLDREVEDFSLEVSSPGATIPLKLVRQYAKHLGRGFEIVLDTGEKLEGTLISTNGDELILENSTRENKPLGKGKITVVKSHTVNLKNIKEAKIKLKF